MSGGWQIFLFLFILGVTAQTFNTFDIWTPKYPDAGYTVSTTVISDAADSSSKSAPTIFVIYQWTITFVTIFVSGLVAVISLSLLFYAMGWPVGVVGGALLTLIQAPATMVALAWVFELFTGRNIG